nr:zinc ribbon domain-containing protein [Desulfoprunum benzoelyticum]
MAREFRESTALADHDLSHLQAAFDPRATRTICPACGSPLASSATTCPDCGLCIG